MSGAWSRSSHGSISDNGAPEPGGFPEGPSEGWMCAGDAGDWIAKERRILELQTAEQRQGIYSDVKRAQATSWNQLAATSPADSVAPDIVLSLFSQPENYGRTKLLLRFPLQEEGDRNTTWELMNKYSGRSWGMPRFIHRFLTVRPIWAANLVYSRPSARILSSSFALFFTLLGVFLLQESVGVKTLDLVYSVHQKSLDFFVHEELEAPTFIYLTSSSIWQNSRDFLASQPPFLPNAVSCEDFQTAKPFCDWRPRLLFEHEGSMKGFCDLPSDTLVSPCGRFNLWMNRDELQLWKLGASNSRHWPQGHFVTESRRHSISGGFTAALQPDGPLDQQTRDSEAPEEIPFDRSEVSMLAPGARVAFERETQLINAHRLQSGYSSSSNGSKPRNGTTTPTVEWLPAEDLRWFLWRRPASTSFILTLYGVIRENLPSATYRFSFPVNEFHPMPPSAKGIRLVSNLASFGTTQFSAATLCFLTAALYSFLWCV